MFGTLIFLLLMGLPLAFVTGGLGVVFLFLFGDAQMLHILPSRIFSFMTDYQLSAIPPVHFHGIGSGGGRVD